MHKVFRIAGLIVGCASTSVSWAQDRGEVIPPPKLDTRLYRLPIDAEAMLWTNDAGTAPTGHWQTRLAVHHMVNPLSYRAPDGSTVDVVSGVSELNILGGVHVSFLRFGLDVPVLLRVDGDQLEPATGLGDIALDLKASITDREGADAPVGVAALVRLSVPTGTVDASVGTEGVGVEVEAIIDKKIGPFLLAGNLGSRFIPTATLGSLEWGSYGYGRMGAGWFITEAAGISVDLAGHRIYGIPSSESVGRPAEGIIGGFGRLSELIVLRGGVGTGLSGGAGAPDFRVITSVGIEAEEVRDRDEDGIRDAVDACPTQPEDLDQFEDEDGCPDATEQVTVHIRNHLGEEVPGATMRVQTESGVQEAGELLSLAMHPGTYEVKAVAERFDEAEVSFVVVEGRDTVVDVRLEPQFGEIRMVLQDPSGGYLAGTMEVEGEGSAPVTGGIGRMDAMEGGRNVTARSDGFLPGTQHATIRAGQRSNLTFVLEPVRARLTTEGIELLEPIVFADGEAVLEADSHSALDQVVGILQAHPEIARLRIEGHTAPDSGARGGGLRAAAQADAVLRYLVDHGVEEYRLEAVGVGAVRPVDTSGTPDANARNQRIELWISERR